MSAAQSLVFLQCLIAGAGLIALLFYKQTAYLGITCLFAFSVASASLSAFFFGHIFGLREQWITPYHQTVLIYSGWMVLAMVAAMWLAWWPSKQKPKNNQPVPEESFAWLTPGFVYFALGIGAIASMAVPFVLFSVATVGTAVNLLASWLKIGLILAVVLFKKRRIVRPLVVAIMLYIPAAAYNALNSGFSPFSIDVIICIALIVTCLDRVNVLSFVKLFVAMVPCVYLMFAWMASRNLIRSGELEQFSFTERAVRFGDAFTDELLNVEVTPYDIQDLLFERIDMSELLAEEAGFEESASGEDQFRFGGTYLDGAYALVPRALWPDKPLVIGYADFVGSYTGTERNDSTSVGVPEQFELYANGGPICVVVGLFILTYLCARLERFIALTKRPLHIMMPSIMFLMAFNRGIEQVMVVLASALAGAITVFIIARAVEVFFPQFLPEFRATRRRRRLGPTSAAAT